MAYLIEKMKLMKSNGKFWTNISRPKSYLSRKLSKLKKAFKNQFDSESQEDQSTESSLELEPNRRRIPRWRSHKLSKLKKAFKYQYDNESQEDQSTESSLELEPNRRRIPRWRGRKLSKLKKTSKNQDDNESQEDQSTESSLELEPKPRKVPWWRKKISNSVLVKFRTLKEILKSKSDKSDAVQEKCDVRSRREDLIQQQLIFAAAGHGHIMNKPNKEALHNRRRRFNRKLTGYPRDCPKCPSYDATPTQTPWRYTRFYESHTIVCHTSLKCHNDSIRLARRRVNFAVLYEEVEEQYQWVMDEAMAGECEEKIIRYDEVPLLLDQEVEEPEPAKRQKCFTCFIGTSRKSRAELLRKEILNHWGPKTLLYMEMLSIGKFSCVAKVRHATNGQVFVVKMLKKLNKLAPEQLLKRFLSEGQAWCTVNGYKFILTLYAYYDTTIGYYFVSEYIHGGSLEDVLLSSIHLSENRCKWVLAQLALAINYLHSKDICHCDVKPSNVLLSDEWIVKLADFGFCQPKGYLLERWGTIAYMAPEILLGKQYDEAIDWWSYGVVAYRLMTGLSPVEAYVVSLGISYSSLTIPERIQACLEAPIDIPYGMSMGAADFLRCMLVEDPWRRLPYYNEEEDFRPVKNHIFFSEIHWPLLEDTGRPVERYPANTLAIAKRYAKRHRYRFRKLRMGVS